MSSPVTDGSPRMAGAPSVARRSRRLPGSASAPALGVASPQKPPTPPGLPTAMAPAPGFGETPRRQSFGSGECAEEKEKPSPRPSPTKTGSDSQNSTPRTPRSVEVRVESQEVAVPGCAWASDGQLEVGISGTVCTVTVKTGISGRSGLSVVLRVGLSVQSDGNDVVSLPPTLDALGSWTVLQVSGVEECDMGRLPYKPGSVPRAPQPGTCRHEWCEATGSSYPRRSGEVTAREALDIGLKSTNVQFNYGINLEVGASCSVSSIGQAKLRIEVRGELRLLPRFVLAGRASLGLLYKAARDLFRAGQDARALQKCEEGVVLADALVPKPREMGDLLNLMGALHLRRQNPTLAVKCLERAFVLREHFSAGGQEDLGLAATLSTLASAHQALGSLIEALNCHERSYAILKANSKPNDPTLASCLHNLGGVHRALGNLSDARKCYEEALAIREEVLSPDDVLTAATLNNLGAVLQVLSDDRGAIRCYQKSLNIQIRVHGSDHPLTVATLGNLGSAHGKLSEHQCAIDCHQRALSVQEKHFGAEDPNVATTLHNLGNALALAGRGGDAARCLWRALSIWSQCSRPAHADIATTLHSLGNVYRGLGDCQAAAQCFAGALRIREAVLGPTHRETARTRHCAALVGCALGEESMALQELDNAAASLLKSLGAKHPWSMQARADAESLRQVVAA